MDLKGKVPTYIYVYEVTASTVPETPVGQFLIDKRRELEHTWEFVQFDWDEIGNDKHTYIHGVRRERVCSTCYAEKRAVRAHDHEHPHFEGEALVPTSVGA